MLYKEVFFLSGLGGDVLPTDLLPEPAGSEVELFLGVKSNNSLLLRTLRNGVLDAVTSFGEALTSTCLGIGPGLR